jgi:hypothetical protein
LARASRKPVFGTSAGPPRTPISRPSKRKKPPTRARAFLADKLPAPLRGPVESALTGVNALDQAKNLVGKL